MNPINQKVIDKLQEELAKKFSITNETELAVLSDDLKDSLFDALDYCNRETVIGNMPSTVKDIYIFRKNTEGVEGETSRSEGGVSQAFEEGLPRKIRSKLNRYRVAKVRSF